MKYKQVIKTNQGIFQAADQKIPGYRREEGMQFSQDDPTYEMMDLMARFVKSCYITPLNLSAPKRILDIGSGAAAFGHHLRRLFNNLEVVSIDGNPETLKSPFIENSTHIVARTDEEYKIVDENNEVVKFDLIVSFEHIEHIEEEKLEIFLKNIATHSTSDTCFLMTISGAAYEGEIEHVHCHVKSPPEWKELLQLQRYAQYGEWDVVNIGEGLLQCQTTHKLYEDLENQDAVAFLVSEYLENEARYFESKFYKWFFVHPSQTQCLQHFATHENAIIGWIDRLNRGTILLKKGSNSIVKPTPNNR